ncbi:putative trans-sialidase, Group I [Trypanosoma cruzi]|uniref:Trans-sialidase, putative n=2 Tax=Trypanosoma cruzi TaxID=5693 RepID=Q4D9H3_TRYCC|nr:trans-sialidase, putative [Trypanosoma cruzi]EAN89180.1 trans-sialidase, putative [Trypanosoma cruzi]PWV14816.1 putative trans-sialidase, Group I [Trypanosoma cruzi]|eukprot:XP_811031.1 trans-sialidase [Trypanosoma cruzi strain CL Brener]
MNNMFRHALTSTALPILLLLLCFGSGAARAEESVSESVELFTPGKTSLSDEEKNKSPISGETVKSFYGHSLVDVDGLMVVIAKANYQSTYSNYGDADTWSRHAMYGDNNNFAKPTVGDEGDWSAAVVVKRGGQERHFTSLYDTKAVAKDDKIFLIVSKNNFGNETSYTSLYNSEVDPELIVGEVKGTGKGKHVSWTEPLSLKTKFEAQMTANYWRKLDGAHGARGILIGEKRILAFPLVATSSLDYGDRTICTVIYSEDNGSNWEFPAKAAVAEDCKDAILLEWEGKVLMFEAYSYWGRSVYESSDMGKTWKSAVRSSFHLLKYAAALDDFSASDDLITANIETKSVILYTSIPLRKEKTRGRIHLWLADGSRVHEVGPISVEVSISNTFSTLLYTRGELFALYAKDGVNTGSNSLVLTHLTEQMQRIKTLLQTWKSVDERVSTLCSSSARKSAPEGAVCVGHLPTIGLVGFFSDNGNATHWNDEYLGVDARVFGEVKKVQYGFELTGSGANIVWLLCGKYSKLAGVRGFYCYYELTLVATVTIKKIPQGITPLVGLNIISKRSLTLFYDNQMRWKMGEKEEEGPQKIAWELGKAYRVVITVHKGEGSAYVDGQRVGSLEGGPSFTLEEEITAPTHPDEDTPSASRESVLNIFFGNIQAGQKEEQNHVTVTNVLWYDHCFSATEVEAMEKTKKEAQPPSKTASPKEATRPPQDVSVDRETSSSSGKGTASHDAPMSDKKKDLYPSAQGLAKPPKGQDIGDVSLTGPLVGVLWLPLLGLWGLSVLL